jgi:hypothetical protein
MNVKHDLSHWGKNMTALQKWVLGRIFELSREQVIVGRFIICALL